MISHDWRDVCFVCLAKLPIRLVKPRRLRLAGSQGSSAASSGTDLQAPTPLGPSLPCSGLGNPGKGLS